MSDYLGKAAARPTREFGLGIWPGDIIHRDRAGTSDAFGPIARGYPPGWPEWHLTRGACTRRCA